jgi:hypothetical protein
MEYENKTLSDDELKHWGIIGMKWGVRRYQNKDGTLTAKGKKRYKDEMDEIKAEKKKLAAQERDKKKLAKLQAEKDDLERRKRQLKGKTDEADETDEQKRDRIMKAPTAKDVYENRHLFSGKELNDLHLRLNTEENIKRLVPKEVDEGKARADKAFETIGDMTEKAIIASKAYNAFAAIYNAFSGTDTVDLPRIDLDSINKGNKPNRKAQKKNLEEEAEKRRKAAEDEADAKKAAKEAEKQAKKDAAEKEKERYKAAKEAEKQATKADKERAYKKSQEASSKSGPTSSSSEKSKVYEGDVIWDKPVSSQTGSTKRAESTIRWVDNLSDTTVPRSNSDSARLGQSYIAGLLPAPKDDD